MSGQQRNAVVFHSGPLQVRQAADQSLLLLAMLFGAGYAINLPTGVSGLYPANCFARQSDGTAKAETARNATAQ